MKFWKILLATYYFKRPWLKADSRAEAAIFLFRLQYLEAKANSLNCSDSSCTESKKTRHSNTI